MLAPKKSFGQHFLHDQSVIGEIVQALGTRTDDMLVEIGPGQGALTRHLVDLSQSKLVLVEADRDLIDNLRQEFPRAEIIAADAAQVDYEEIVGDRPWILVGNLPYNAANAILMHALQAKHQPRALVIMVQKEVGERLLALQGCMSVLSVAAQLYAQVQKICLVKPGAFTPPPKVDSMVLRLIPWADGVHDDVEEIIALAKVGFSSRRKQLHGNLAQAGLGSSTEIKAMIESLGLNPFIRAEELTIDNWRGLLGALGRGL